MEENTVPWADRQLNVNELIPTIEGNMSLIRSGELSQIEELLSISARLAWSIYTSKFSGFKYMGEKCFVHGRNNRDWASTQSSTHGIPNELAVRLPRWAFVSGFSKEPLTGNSDRKDAHSVDCSLGWYVACLHDEQGDMGMPKGLLLKRWLRLFDDDKASVELAFCLDNGEFGSFSRYFPNVKDTLYNPLFDPFG